MGPGSGQCGFYRSSLSSTSSQGLSGVSHWSYSPGSRNEGGKKLPGFLHISAENATAAHHHQPHSQAALCTNSPTLMTKPTSSMSIAAPTPMGARQVMNVRKERKEHGVDECMSAFLEWVGRPGVQSPLKRPVTPQHQQSPMGVNTATFKEKVEI